jgi:serine/threonine protein kinase
MPRQSKKAKLAQTERNIMQKLKHPFIMSIYYAFQTQSAPCVLSRLTPVRAHSCV